MMRLLLLLIVLSGCADDPPQRWRNIDDRHGGQMNFDQDYYQCAATSTRPQGWVYGRMGEVSSRTDWDLTRACLRAHGWRPVSS